MGTNLSQVFVSNTDVLETGTTFNGTVTFPEIGIWNLAGNSGTGAYVNTALYSAGVDITDEVGTSVSQTNEVNDNLTTVAHPVWLFNRLQFVQATPNFNPIATPIINTTNIKRIKYDPYTAFVGTKATIADATLNVSSAANNDEYNFKFIIRSTPTDYLNFYDQNAANLFTKEFPLGTFNTTNHKAINVTVKIPVVADAGDASNITAISNALAAHPLLGNMFTAAAVSSEAVITARHPGVVFDLLISNVTKAKDAVACAIVGQTLGVGNAWQVLGEEIKCRSRYGNFNRMYLPQNMPTFTNTTAKYDKITIQYEHNWPTSTGIAPAGTLNEVVLYYTDADYTAPELAADSATNTFDNAFVYTIATAKEFLW